MSELETALAEFAITRSGALARVIEQLGRAALEDLVAPDGSPAFRFHQAWIQLAADPRRITWCVEHLVDHLPRLESEWHRPTNGDPMVKRWVESWRGHTVEAVVERMQVLQAAAPDPRIARGVLALFERGLPIWKRKDVEWELAPLLLKHADDELVHEPALDRIHRLDRTTLPSPVGPEAAARVQARTPVSRHDTAAMLELIHADLDADEPRAILADALQEDGDPRGDFIALQLAEARGNASEELRDRAEALLATHGKAWLGPLKRATLRGVMRRGFLARLELAGAWKSGTWDELAQSPLLATVEELWRGDASAKIYAVMLGGRIARSVRAIEVFDNAIWNVVMNTPMPRLRELRVMEWYRRPYDEHVARRVMPWVEQHPELATFACNVSALGGMTDSARARVTEAHASGPLTAELIAWWTRLPTLRSLQAYWIRLVRDGDREFARVFEVHAALDDLPPSIARLEVPTPAIAKAIAAQVGERFEVVVVPEAPVFGKLTGTG